jgi:hypothetical protein
MAVFETFDFAVVLEPQAEGGLSVSVPPCPKSQRDREGEALEMAAGAIRRVLDYRRGERRSDPERRRSNGSENHRRRVSDHRPAVTARLRITHALSPRAGSPSWLTDTKVLGVFIRAMSHTHAGQLR